MHCLRAFRYEPEVTQHLKDEQSRQIKMNKGFDGKTAATKEREAPRKDDCTIIVHGLKVETDELTIYKSFTKVGKVRDVQILKDNNTNQDRKGKGIAFVEFYDSETVEKALELTGVMVDGRAR